MSKLSEKQKKDLHWHLEEHGFERGLIPRIEQLLEERVDRAVLRKLDELIDMEIPSTDYIDSDILKEQYNELSEKLKSKDDGND